MNTDRQLRAIYALSMKDGLSYSDLCDITNWYEQSHEGEYDTSRLTDKARERIGVIYAKYFKD